MEKLWLWSVGRELWGPGARLGPGAEPCPCIEARGRWTVVPCTAGEVPRLVSSGPELSPGSPRGGCSWWLLVGSAPSSLRPSGLTSSTSVEAAIPGDVTSWFADMAEIFCFSVFLQHVVVLTVHLQIGPGSMQRPSEVAAGAGGPRPLCSPQTSVLPGDGPLSQVRISHLLLGPSEAGCLRVQNRSGGVTLHL